MSRSSPTVSIIILNWNNYRDTINCMESLDGISHDCIEIIIVDNGSTDNSIVKIRNCMGDDDKSTLIKNDKNKGFAGGVNTGIKHALKKGSEYILLLNNDITVEEDFLSPLVETANSDNRTGMVAPLTLMQGKDVVQDAGREIDKFRLRLKNPHKGRSPSEVNGEFEVSGLSFACVLLRSEMVRELGLLEDETFFFGGEDVEYCLRAQENGWLMKCNTDSVVHHKVSSTAGAASDFLIYHRTRNQITLGNDYYGLAGTVGVLYKSFIHLLSIIYFILTSKFDQIKPILCGHIDYYCGNFQRKYINEDMRM